MYNKDYIKEALDRENKTREKLSELDRMRTAIEENYHLFDMNENIFKLFYNENENIWEITFKEDSFTVAETEAEGQYLCMVFQIIYTESLSEGILIGINNPNLGADLLKRKAGLDTSIHDYASYEQISFEDFE